MSRLNSSKSNDQGSGLKYNLFSEAEVAFAASVLSIEFIILPGGSCLDHLELRLTDEAFLEALGFSRLPDSTTAGDYCRSHELHQNLLVMTAVNRAPKTDW